jgi:hypothetical protein
VKPAKLCLRLGACLALGLTACATATSSSTGTAALTTVSPPNRHAHTSAGCPLGRLLPHGTGEAIDYVDFLQFGGRMYFASGQPIKAAALGRVITHIRCSLAAEENVRRGAPPIVDRTAASLPAGTAVYQVRGYPPGCRLAAYSAGRLRLYLAQTMVNRHVEPLPCALAARS